MRRYILFLTEIRDSDGPRVGSKALRLAQLARAGLPVPPGFCLTTDAYHAFLEASAPPGTEPDPLALREAEVPSEVARAVEEACAALSPFLAIRSSATAEDLPEASFAGQYDTFLNVAAGEGRDGLVPLLTAVRGCWAAPWSERARAYAVQCGTDPRRIGMAVLIQQQIPAEAAGVLFSLNPLSGREEEMLVEAVWGLGAPLVAGEVTPDRYVVNPYDRRVLRREPADRPTMWIAAPQGGTREVAVPPDRRGRPVLDDRQLLELAELGYQVQALYGFPQDVEWALADGHFYLLQTRPMTAFQFDPGMGQWTSANHREVLPGFASPLSLSLSLEIEYGRALAGMFRDLKMGEAPPGTVWGRPFFGRPYWNVGVVKQFAALIPGFKERTFDATVGIDPAYEGDGLTTPWTPRTILRALPVLFALNRRYETCWQEAAAFADHFRRAEEPEVAAVDPAALTDDELAEWVRRMADLHQRANHVAITVSLLAAQAQDEFTPTLARLNRNLPPGEAIPYGDLIAGLGWAFGPSHTGPGEEAESLSCLVGTARPMLELWGLARRGREQPEVAGAVAEEDPAQMPRRLQATPAGRAFWAEVEAFIQRYRYMGRVDEDLAQPRWDEDPSFVLTTLQAYIHLIGDGDVSREPARQVTMQREQAQAAEARAMAALSRGWRRFWPFPRRSFRQQLERVRRYVWWREEMRVIASMAFYHCRRFFLELGRRWTAAGWLEGADEVFLLRWQEIEAALDGRLGPEEIRRAIERYRRLRTAYRNFEPPNVIGRGTRPFPLPSGQVTLLQGTPCSSGWATGPARVVRDLEEARSLEKGEILVAPYTNPGWTPLFHLTAGLVIEAGGLLSHGAVVAREYGIPTVIGVEGATRILRTGQQLAVDGARGTIQILG